MKRYFTVTSKSGATEYLSSVGLSTPIVKMELPIGVVSELTNNHKLEVREVSADGKQSVLLTPSTVRIPQIKPIPKKENDDVVVKPPKVAAILKVVKMGEVMPKKKKKTSIGVDFG